MPWIGQKKENKKNMSKLWGLEEHEIFVALTEFEHFNF